MRPNKTKLIIAGVLIGVSLLLEAAGQLTMGNSEFADVLASVVKKAVEK